MRLRARAKWVPKEAVDWKQGKKQLAGKKKTYFSEEGAAGALSSLLVPLLCPPGFVFHYGELDFLLHVVNAINDHTSFVPDGVGLLRTGADDLAGIFVVRVIIVCQGVERHKAFNKQLRQFDEEAELGDADDQAIKVLAHALFHELEFLPFQQFALGFSGGAFRLAGAFSDFMQFRLRDGASERCG